jgi:hypothetical protein
VFGEHLVLELGVDPRIVELLIERGSALNTPLNLAACFNRAELVRMLLAAGADPLDTEVWSVTPLQTAVYHGAREAADLRPRWPSCPMRCTSRPGPGKWITWRSGSTRPVRYGPRRCDCVRTWPMSAGRRRRRRAIGRRTCSTRRSASPRTAVGSMLRFLLKRGVNGSVYLGMTPLHMTVINRRTETARWLVEHGADVARRDEIHHGTPLGWAEHSANGSAIHHYLASLG